MEEISEAAGLSRGAFYSNYDSKEELFLTLIGSRIQGGLAEITEAFQKGDTAEKRIRSGGRYLDSLIAQDRQWCLLYMEFWSRAGRDPKHRRRFAAQYEAWRIGIAHIIENAVPGARSDTRRTAPRIGVRPHRAVRGTRPPKLIDPKGLEEGFFTRLLLRFFGRFGAFSPGAEVQIEP